MKTTVDLSDELLLEIQRIAREQNRTVKSLIEEGLRDVIASHQRAEVFRLPDASVDGNGLQPRFRDASWEEIREAAYGNRL
ncbi:MAG TPA: type II toxin-antitoxin system VapB family antitoxin [Streptosporangiaceae bacterium]|nr:type II toxin-antitoxin system VapB family antitoxin [Streptosporangiaceae bacterium]